MMWFLSFSHLVSGFSYESHIFFNQSVKHPPASGELPGAHSRVGFREHPQGAIAKVNNVTESN